MADPAVQASRPRRPRRHTATAAPAGAARRLLVVAGVALLAIPAIQADGVHSVVTDMYIHFAGEEILPTDPVEPAGQVLPAAPAASLCEEPLRWTAASNRAPPAYDGSGVTWTPGLLREALLDPDRAPRLTWYLETVAPGTGDPVDLAAPDVVVDATMRLGSTSETFGRGQVVAEGASSPVVMHSLGSAEDAGVEGRFVYRFEVRLDWVEDARIPAQDGFHIEIAARQATDGCDGAPVGVRAYSGPGVRPHMRWHVIEPVRIDLLEGRVQDNRTTLLLHASSPWGAFDVLLDAADLTGPRGNETLPEARRLGEPGLALQWDLDHVGLGNGTYRIDTEVSNLQQSERVSSFAVFRIGEPQAPAPRPETGEPQTRDSPAGIALLLAGLALAAMRRR